MDLKPGILLALSMSKRTITVLDLHGTTFEFFLNTKYYDKNFISYTKTALKNDVLIPVGCCEDGKYGEVVYRYYTDTEYSMFETETNVKVDYLQSIYDCYVSSLEDIDTFELPDLTTEELRIVDELNESLFDLKTR